MAKLTTCPLLMMALVFAVGLLFIATTATASRVVDDQEEANSDEVENWVMEKRPFCNAFAGCGRKRASSAKDLVSGPLERILNNYPRLSNADNKLWDKLYAKLQQRYRTNYEASKN